MSAPVAGAAHLPQERVEEVVVNLPGAVLIGIGEGAVRRGLSHAEVGEFAQTAAEPTTDLAEGLRPRELGEEHRDKLIPTGVTLGIALPPVTLYDLRELEAGEELQQSSRS